MSLEVVLILVYSLLMLVWNGHLMKQNAKLLDRLMSRNYGEYATAEKYLAPDPVKREVVEEAPDPYDEHRATELNTMMGMS